jgi:hypothetical protein
MSFRKIVMGSMALLCALQSASVFANGVGNGGHFVLKNGKYYLLDLIEAGIEGSPAIVDNEPVPAQLASEAENLFSPGGYGFVTADDRKQLLAIFQTLSTTDAQDLIVAIYAYTWKWVDQPIVPVNDVNSSLQLDPNSVFQGAVRRDFSILVNSQIWANTDSWNRAALIIHEVVYSLLTPIPDAPGSATFHQDSVLARQIVGDIFSGAFRGFDHYVRNGKPVIPLSNETHMNENEWNSPWNPIYWKGSDQNAAFKFSPILAVTAVDPAVNDQLSISQGADLMGAKTLKDLETFWFGGEVDSLCSVVTPGQSIGFKVTPTVSEFSVAFANYTSVDGDLYYLVPKITQPANLNPGTQTFTYTSMSPANNQSACLNDLLPKLQQWGQLIFQ